MRILILVILLFSLRTHASEPVIYGKLNVMMRYITQDAGGYSTFANVEEGTSPSRLGVKGSLGKNTNYTFETGFSSQENAITIRIAQLSFHGKYGKLQAGQGWTTTGLLGLIIDPLAHTGASSWGSRTYNAIGGGVTHQLGFLSTVRAEQLTYTTPLINGITLSTGVHRNDNIDRTSTAVNNSYESLLKYQGKSTTIYIGGVSTHGVSYKKEASYMFGGILNLKNISLSGLYGLKKVVSNADRDLDQKHLLLTAKYRMNKNDFIISYTTRNDDSYSVRRSQLSLGHLYNLNQNTQFNLAISYFDFQTGSGNPDFLSFSQNDALSFIAGATLNF